MRGKRKMRFLAMLMAVIIGVTSLSDSVLAAFSSTAQEADARDTLKKLEEGQEIDAQDAKYILEHLGLFNEDGSAITSKIVIRSICREILWILRRRCLWTARS